MKDHGPKQRLRSDDKWPNDHVEKWVTIIGIGILMLSIGVAIGARVI